MGCPWEHAAMHLQSQLNMLFMDTDHAAIRQLHVMSVTILRHSDWDTNKAEGMQKLY